MIMNGYEIYAEINRRGELNTCTPPKYFHQWEFKEGRTIDHQIWCQVSSNAVLCVTRILLETQYSVMYVGYDRSAVDSQPFKATVVCGSFDDLNAAIVAAQMMGVTA